MTNLGRVPTTSNTHLLVDFPPLFDGFSLRTSSALPQNLLNWRQIASKSGYFRLVATRPKIATLPLPNYNAPDFTAQVIVLNKTTDYTDTHNFIFKSHEMRFPQRSEET